MGEVSKTIIRVADTLDRVGYPHLATKLDNIFAQLADSSDIVTEVDNKVYRTIFLQFERLHSLLDHILPKIRYFEKNDVALLKNTLIDVRKALEIASKDSSSYDNKALEQYSAHIKQLREKVSDLLEAPVTKKRVIQDRYAILGEIENFTKYVSRATRDELNGQSIIQALQSVINVYENIIRRTAEQIAEVDLTKEQ